MAWLLDTNILSNRRKPKLATSCEVCFYSAVEETELRQRFQFLGNDRLFGVCPEHRRREIQQAWVFNVRGSRSNDIAEADIELHWNSRSCERCVELNSDTLVIRVLLDPADLDGRPIECDAIGFRIDFAYCGDHLFNVIELIVHSTFEIDVHGGPGLRRPPGG